MLSSSFHKLCLSALLTSLGCCVSVLSFAEGEAGIISLRGQGHFYVGIETTEPERNGAVQIWGQMYVGFQLAAEQKYPYPIILVHGGSGQATNWFSTPDDRDGWRDYFLAAGFDVYWVDLPGYGRSPTNVSYGELRDSANTGIISFLAQSEQWPGNPNDHLDPSILTTLASAPPGPYAGDKLAAKDLSFLLDKIGPAIIMTYSAGAVSGWWAADMNPDNVAAIVAVEPASSNITSSLRKGLTFSPALSRDFQPVPDEDNCDLQDSNHVSTLTNLKKVPVKFIGAELGLTRSLPCSIKALRQAGVDVDYLFLPDIGISGNGHFLMVERNNGEIAMALIELMSAIK